MSSLSMNSMDVFIVSPNKINHVHRQIVFLVLVEFHIAMVF
jgi:hypothetical protein